MAGDQSERRYRFARHASVSTGFTRCRPFFIETRRRSELEAPAQGE